MTIGPGTRIGPFEITALIGEGGMGQVYRATDTNLKRTVAIKVLPASVAADADRLARFQREAELLARLNHPNIAQIHGLEKGAGITALVMEFIDGPTLADRIALGPIPVDEALAIAREIAAALEAAHEQGIIHRDLKPANIKVRPDGAVKVLDFGLAKAIEGAGTADRAGNVTNSPTITSPAMTGMGMLLGTAAYMSPEQARGRAVDKRTDVWAFGAVLYEMLTGQRPFGPSTGSESRDGGNDVSDVLASVLAREPDWTRLPAGLSPIVATFIKRCLHKDRQQRVRDIGDMSLALSGAFESGRDDRPSAAPTRPFWRRALPAAAASIMAVGLTALVAWNLRPAAVAPSPARFEYVLPEGQTPPASQRPIIAISADGGAFVYQTARAIYVRAMGELEGRAIPGATEPASTPFMSPDGQWVGYVAGSGGGQIKKIPIMGGTPTVVCAAPLSLGVSWARDNTMLFGQAAGIMRVSANGGTPELIIKAGEDETFYGPELLPGGGAVLFSVTTDRGPNRWNVAKIVVQSLTSSERTVVVDGGSDAHYLPTGHLVYVTGNVLFGAKFDPRHPARIAAAVPLMQGIQRPAGNAAASSNYAVSDDGTLIHLAGVAALRSLVWVNRDGSAAEPISAIPPGGFEDPRLSPDGERVLITQDGDIWIYDVASGRKSRVTRDGTSLFGVWNPAGSEIAYSSARGGSLEAWVSASDGSGEPRQLTRLGGTVHVDSWSPDGRTLALHHHPAGQGGTSMLMLPMDQADAKPVLFGERALAAEGAQFSRDMRHVSYLSTETGQREIYVRPYSGPGGHMIVSVGGAQEPIWAKNGEVFYRSLPLAGNRMFAAPVTTNPALKVGTPVTLFQGPYYVSLTGSPRPQYDVTPDGKRFLMLASAPGADTRSRIVVVQHWFEEVKRRLPAN